MLRACLLFVLVVVSARAESWVTILSGGCSQGGGSATIEVQRDGDYTGAENVHRLRYHTIRTPKTETPATGWNAEAFVAKHKTGFTFLEHIASAANGGPTDTYSGAFLFDTTGGWQLSAGWTNESNWPAVTWTGTWSGAAPVNNKLRIKYDNTGGAATMQLMVMKDGVQYGAIIDVAPGVFFSTTLENVPEGSYSVVTKVKDWVQSEAGTWTASPGSAQLVSTTPVPSGNISETPTDTVIPTAQPPNVPSSTATPSGAVWRAPVGGGGSTPTDLLTNSVFREGIDKVNDRQDKQTNALEKLRDWVDGIVHPNGDKTPAETQSLMQGAANTLRDSVAPLLTNATTSIDSLMPSGSTEPTVTSGGSLVLLSLPMPGGGTKEVKMSGVVPAVDSGATWIREIFLWGMALIFILQAFAKFERYNMAVAAVPQLTAGTDVVAMTVAGGLVKQAIIAAIIMGSVVAFIVALVGTMNTKLGSLTSSWSFTNIGNIGGLILGTGHSSEGANAFSIIDRWFPIWASVQYSVAWLALGVIAAGSFILAAGVIRVARI